FFIVVFCLWIRFNQRPVSGKNIISFAAQKQIEWTAECLLHRLGKRIIPIGKRPATKGKSAGCIFFWPSRCLHNAIEANKSTHDNISHIPSPYFSFLLYT